MRFGLFFLALLILPYFSFAQFYKFSRNYKEFELVFDEEKHINFLTDTITKTRVDLLNGVRAYPGTAYFRGGRLIQVRCGDMKSLFNMKGELLLKHCHLYRMHKEYTNAWVCGAGWIILDTLGNVRSCGNMGNNQLPKLSEELTPVLGFDRTPKIPMKFGYGDFSIRTSKQFFGYLNNIGEWTIKPQYQNALPFEGSFAKVKARNYWGIINRKGEWVVAPKFESKDFGIERELEK